MTSPLKIAIIGCGNIAANHAEAYRALPDVALVGAVDPLLERAESFVAANEAGRAYASLDDLLANEAVDAISICTPHPTHVAILERAAQAGVHVLCEKPIAVDVADAERMVRTAKDAGITFGAVFQRRFWPAAQDVRAAIDDGTLGEPILARVTALLHREPEYYTELPWRGKWDTDGGGVLMTQTIHYIDLLEWYCGPVAEVHAFADTYKFGEIIEVEDTIAVNLRFASGAIGQFVASTALTPGLGSKIEITGSNGATLGFHEFPEGAPAREHLHAVPGEVAYAEVLDANQPDIPLSEINGALKPYHQLQIADFVDALRTGRQPLITGAEALGALRTTQAIYESARTGNPVVLEPLALEAHS